MLLKRNITGRTLARIAVEVLEGKDLNLLVQSKKVDWNERAENEDPAIMWALNQDKFDLLHLLLESPGINLNIRDGEGWSFLARAISKKNLSKKLCRENNLN